VKIQTGAQGDYILKDEEEEEKLFSLRGVLNIHPHNRFLSTF